MSKGYTGPIEISLTGRAMLCVEIRDGYWINLAFSGTNQDGGGLYRINRETLPDEKTAYEAMEKANELITGGAKVTLIDNSYVSIEGLEGIVK